MIAGPALVVEYIAPILASEYIAPAPIVVLESPAPACRVVRGTGSSGVRHASVSGGVQRASVSRDPCVRSGGRARRTGARLPRRDASPSRVRSASASGSVHLAVPPVTCRNGCSSGGVHCLTTGPAIMAAAKC